MRDANAYEAAVAMSEKRWRVLLGPAADDTAINLTRALLAARGRGHAAWPVQASPRAISETPLAISIAATTRISRSCENTL